MSERERWIVYPLLFFSFALAIRDQGLFSREGQRDEFNVVNCQHLVVRDAQGNVAVDIHAKHGKPGVGTTGSGVVTIYGATTDGGSAKPAAVRLYTSEKKPWTKENFGVVETYSPLGSRAAMIAGDGTGGTMFTFDAASKVRAALLPIRITRTPSNPTQPHGTDSDDDPRSAVPQPPQP